MCKLCLQEKLSILRSAPSLIKRSEIFGHCIHGKKFLLNNTNNSLSTDEVSIVDRNSDSDSEFRSTMETSSVDNQLLVYIKGSVGMYRVFVGNCMPNFNDYYTEGGRDILFLRFHNFMGPRPPKHPVYGIQLNIIIHKLV